MTEQERREEEILKNCIQEAYGCSDEQLLAELEEIEASLSDDEFPGVEERMFERLMSRVEMEEAEIGTCEVSEMKDIEAEESKVADIKELPKVRIKKRKVLVVGILAAAFIAVLGGTAIGDRNYLLRERENVKGIFYNETNLSPMGDIFTAYEHIKEDFGGKCLALNDWPDGMVFIGRECEGANETLIFEYLENRVYFIQIKKDKISSVNMPSDGNVSGTITNTWLNMELEYSENKVDNGNIEYESRGLIGDITYCIRGKMQKSEFEKIIKSINYY